MNNLALAREIKAALPNCEIIHRVWPDDGMPTEAPEVWVARKRAEIGNADVWAYTTNEPALTPGLAAWHVRAMRAALAVGLKLCVFNFSVGVPDPAEWWVAHEALQLLAAAPNQFVLGLHEYACGVAISGARGFEELAAQPSKWPANLRERGPLWHCGRFQFLVDYCAQREMRPPRIVITEAGFDSLQDVQSWTNTLLRTPPYGEIRGWKTLANQWRAWWPAWDAERAYFEQMKYLQRALYDNSPVEALLLFTWSANPAWAQFDLSNALTFQRLVESETDMTIDVNPSVDDPRWQPYTAKAMPAGTRLRQNPSTNSAALAVLVGELDVHHIPFSALTPAEQARAQQADGRWYVLKADASQQVGWVREDVIKLTPKQAPAPAPAPAPETPATYVTAEQLAAAMNALREEIQAWARKEFTSPAQSASAVDARLLELGSRLATAWREAFGKQTEAPRGEST